MRLLEGAWGMWRRGVKGRGLEGPPQALILILMQIICCVLYINGRMSATWARYGQARRGFTLSRGEISHWWKILM